MIDARPEIGAILEAIRGGRVELVTEPLSWIQLIRFIVESESVLGFTRDSLRYMVRVLRRTRATRYAGQRGQVAKEPRGGR